MSVTCKKIYKSGVSYGDGKRRFIFKISGAESRDTFDLFVKNQRRLGKILKIELLSAARNEDEAGTPYPFRLEDERNNELWISGATSGYHGSEPEATIAILKTPKIRKLLDYREITPTMVRIIVYSCSNFVISRESDRVGVVCL